MTRINLFFLFVLSLFMYSNNMYAQQQNNGFYLHLNGVTVVCTDADFDSTGVVNGVEYTKRSRNRIGPRNAATTCTSGITDMGSMFREATAFNQDISGWCVSEIAELP